MTTAARVSCSNSGLPDVVSLCDGPQSRARSWIQTRKRLRGHRVDLNMPGQNGIELTRQIVGNRPDVPIVVITAFSMASAVEAMRAGAYDFVTKPLEVDALVFGAAASDPASCAA